MHLFLTRIPSPIGTVLLVSDGRAVRALDFEDFQDRMHQLLRLHYGAVELTDGEHAQGRTAVGRYFDGKLDALDALAVETGGTPFQRAVWAELRNIPPGATISYGTLAARLGRPGSSRAVGAANGANPVAIAVPCHRVIGANSHLTGYGGGLERKRWLLHHEAAHAPTPSLYAPPPPRSGLG